MKDEIFYGNIKGLLERGRWTLSLEEAFALIQLHDEVKKRLDHKPNLIVPLKEPIRKKKK